MNFELVKFAEGLVKDNKLSLQEVLDRMGVAQRVQKATPATTTKTPTGRKPMSAEARKKLGVAIKAGMARKKAAEAKEAKANVKVSKPVVRTVRVGSGKPVKVQERDITLGNPVPAVTNRG